MHIRDIAIQARTASRQLLTQNADIRKSALQMMCQSLQDEKKQIFKANEIDLSQSQKQGLAEHLLKRLKFDQEKLQRVCQGIATLSNMDDQVNQTLLKRELDENLILSKVTCPIGVIGMVFESRPDALVQMAALCARSANAVILKGGSEATQTNKVLTKILTESSIKAGLPNNWLQLVQTRKDIHSLLKLVDLIDLVIPRGSNQFVAQIMNDSAVPVLGHADGICHIYIDCEANLNQALDITIDSKMQYVAACNAVETLLVHKEIAKDFLFPLQQALEDKGCTILGCEQTQTYIDVKSAKKEDWKTEYLDAKISVKIVNGIEEAIEHIHCYGSGHTEAIITENNATAEFFMNRVDSADIFHNCSTRFSDGFVFGMGAEVGISTLKIHARGPVGVDGLLSYRWQLRGHGHLISAYSQGNKSFTHRNLPQ